MFKAYANYWDFQGRASRSEYWLFFLWMLILLIPAVVIDVAAFHQVSGFGPCVLVVGFANLIPNLSVGVRRLHDIGRSGWWLLLYFAPVVSLSLFVMSLLPGTPGENAFGPQPGGRSYDDLQATFA
jgi:uncharacterized membrane protein YhaH (DUF805 family)